MDIGELLVLATEKGASDLHITAGMPPAFRINGNIIRLDSEPLTQTDTEHLVKGLMNEKQLTDFLTRGELDFSYSISKLGRFRVNVYRQRGSMAAAIRLVASEVPPPEKLGLPASVLELANKTRGLVLVTGPTGSGKSTTLSSLVNLINTKRACHILTLEDPIEYLHRHDKSIVNQREIGIDSLSYANALKAAMRQDPDVILVGEMRDLETISIAITAAETGHLVFSTLHTIGAAKTIDRIIDVFPPHQQQQVRVQLATALQAVISQQLLHSSDMSGRVAAFEIMMINAAVRNLIREGKTHQINNVIQTGQKQGMITMDNSLAELCRRKRISREDAMSYAVDQEALARLLMQI